MSKPARNLSRRCEWCAGGRVVRRVAVVPLRPDVPEVDALALCAGCRESPWRTTWRRYRRASLNKCGICGTMSFSIANCTPAGDPGIVNSTLRPSNPPIARLNMAAGPIS